MVRIHGLLKRMSTLHGIDEVVIVTDHVVLDVVEVLRSMVMGIYFVANFTLVNILDLILVEERSFGNFTKVNLYEDDATLR